MLKVFIDMHSAMSQKPSKSASVHLRLIVTLIGFV